MTVGIYQNLGPVELKRDQLSASSKWAKRFRRDYQFGVRAPHRAWRNRVNNKYVGFFIQKLWKEIQEYHPRNILSTDKSCLHLPTGYFLGQ